MRYQFYSQRWWDLPATLLLMAAMLTSGTRLVVTEWTADLSIVQTLVFFGTIAGLAAGSSWFKPRTVGFIVTIYGLFMIPWQLGRTLPIEIPWSEKILVLINRVRIIVSQLVFREPVRDSLLFLVVMFALYWTISTYAGYVLTRHGDGWMAVLPGGSAMFVIHNFDQAVSNRIWYLAAYLFFSLILVSRMTFVHRRTRWQESRTALPPHISLDFIRYTVLAAFVVVMFAWTMPALAKALPQASRVWQPVRIAWNDSVNNFENAFASLKSTVFTYAAVYSPTSSLGRGAVLSDAQIFQARAPLTLPIGTRLYWRARIYDTYENGQWRTSLENTYPFDPLVEELPIETGSGRWQGEFTILSATNMATLFTPAQPIWVSRAGEVEYETNPDGTIDIVTFSSAPPLGPGQSYQILASVSNPTVREMAESGSNYPEWIRSRYLQLPDTITPRTKALAQQITAGLETPYEKVVAITDYLRSNIRYVEVLEEAPPSNQEPVDWFLFESQEGFCNYYSSAEIIMLRSLGIPARWAVGYAQGDLLDDSETGFIPKDFNFIVRQRDAHSWPEVYFEGLGWVEFEPTVSQPDIFRPRDPADEALNRLTEEEELAALREDQREMLSALREQAELAAASEAAAETVNPVRLALTILGIIGFLVFSLWMLPVLGLPTAPKILQLLLVRTGIKPSASLKRWAEQPSRFQKNRLPPLPILLERLFMRFGQRTPEFIRRWARQAELPPLSRAYLEINRGLSLFGRPPAANDTPAERAANLGRLIPPAEPPAIELVGQYQIGTFSQQSVNLVKAQESADRIRKLAWSGYLKSLLKRFQKPDVAERLRSPRNR